jgi:hypothetical protein
MNLPALVVMFVVVAVVFWLNFWVGLAVALTAPYWLGPVLVRMTSRYACRAAFTPYRPGIDPAPEWARVALGQVAVALAPLGFRVVASFAIDQWAKHLRTVTVMLAHPETKALAVGMAVFTEGTPVARQVAVAELVTRYDADTARTTSNSTQPVVFAPVARDGRPPVDPLAGATPEALLRESMVREMNAQVAAGLMSTDGTAWRPTWKGAFRFAWRLLFPLKQLQVAAVRKRAAALRAELGI